MSGDSGRWGVGVSKFCERAIESLFSRRRGFPGGSDGEESSCNVGDMGLIPGLGRCPGGGHGNLLLESPWTDSAAGYSPRGCKELDMTEWLSTAHIREETQTQPSPDTITRWQKQVHKRAPRRTYPSLGTPQTHRIFLCLLVTCMLWAGFICSLTL